MSKGDNSVGKGPWVLKFAPRKHPANEQFNFKLRECEEIAEVARSLIAIDKIPRV